MNHEEKGYVQYGVHGGIGTIEFFHPASNALTGRMMEWLAQSFHAAGNEEACRVVVLKSAGEGAFCAGASIDELLAVTNREQGERFFSHFGHLLLAMRHCPKPIIARIHGKCVGGGVGIAAASDYAIAHTDAGIRLGELALGIAPLMVGPAAARKMGVSAFSQLALDAGIFRTADWARRKGLYAELHASDSELDEATQRMAHALAGRSSEALSELKQELWANTADWETLMQQHAATSSRLLLSAPAREALAAFKSNKIKQH